MAIDSFGFMRAERVDFFMVLKLTDDFLKESCQKTSATFFVRAS